MPRIKFSEEWDKLKPKKFKKKEVITTFRVYTPRKRKYYYEQLANNGMFDVCLKQNDTEEILGKVRLISVDDRWSHSLTPNEIEKDTYVGWTSEEFRNFLKEYYDDDDIFGLWLKFRIEEVNKR